MSDEQVKLKVKGKVLETTDLPEDQPPKMTPDEMADILNRAMKVIQDNNLTEELDNVGDVPPQDEPDQQPSCNGGDSEQGQGGGGGGGLQPKLFCFSSYGQIYAVVAMDILQAAEHRGLWVGDITLNYETQRHEDSHPNYKGMIPPFNL